MAFTNIPNGNLQVGAPLRSVDILALRDNIPAVMNGDTGAPKIKAAAFEGQSGAAPVFAARAWVNFNGTGTVAIRASGNVSSITDNGTGDYTVNFATAMPDANYAAKISSRHGLQTSNTGTATAQSVRDPQTTSCRFFDNLISSSGTPNLIVQVHDSDLLCVSIHR